MEKKRLIAILTYERGEEFIMDNGKDKIAKVIVKLATASYGLV